MLSLYYCGTAVKRVHDLVTILLVVYIGVMHIACVGKRSRPHTTAFTQYYIIMCVLDFIECTLSFTAGVAMNMSQGPPVPPQDNGGGRGMCTRYYATKFDELISLKLNKMYRKGS